MYKNQFQNKKVIGVFLDPENAVSESAFCV